MEAGFLKKDSNYREKAGRFRQEFEEVLKEVVGISDGMVRSDVLKSNEIVTNFTLPAERKTSQLTGILIDFGVTEQERSLTPAGSGEQNHTAARGLTPAGSGGQNHMVARKVRVLNQRSFHLVDELIHFKEEILEQVSCCRLFTTNYPLLIEHILREARVYQSFLRELETRGTITSKCIRETEVFWNQIMMEHALFIRGLLDPSEEKLIAGANDFAQDYKSLLEQAQMQDCRDMEELTRKALRKTEKYRDFKAAGTKGILECEIASIILPLLGDHVLREANHYLRILQNTCDNVK